MTTKDHRDEIALFFETLSQKKDANYKVSQTKFENMSALVEFLIQTCENQEDLANAAVLLYYTQYFCYTNEEEKRVVFLAERLQELTLVKNAEFWEKAFAAMIYVGQSHPQDQMMLSRKVEKWRIFVNLYFRNYRVLHYLFPETGVVEELMDKVKERADVEDGEELDAKMREIAGFPFEKERPQFIMKRPFVGFLNCRMTKSV